MAEMWGQPPSSGYPRFPKKTGLTVLHGEPKKLMWVVVSTIIDDIIRLNKKQKQLQGYKTALRKHKLPVRGRLNQGRRMGAPLQRGE